MKKFVLTGGNGFIGTNLLLAIREQFNEEVRVYIIDLQPPLIDLAEGESWLNLDILNKDELEKAFLELSPDIVIHLAAITSCDPALTMDDYLTNTEGSTNVYLACEKAGIDFLVNTSTQYVHQSNCAPVNDSDFAPLTLYGESKIIAENNLRNNPYSFNWVIIRPTNVWGRWHPRYPHEFWKVVYTGRYFHPGSKAVRRCYGYVGNVCYQILQLVEMRSSEQISKRVVYVGDQPINLFDWVNNFSLAITSKPVRIVPRFIVFTAALIGSCLQKLKIKFPITISRYNNMTSDDYAPMDQTFMLLGAPKYSMQQGVDITAQWLRDFWRK